jgi:hypothetical protein
VHPGDRVPDFTRNKRFYPDQDIFAIVTTKSRWLAMAAVIPQLPGDDVAHNVRLKTVAEVRALAMSFEYRKFPSKLSVAADMVNRHLCTQRLAAQALIVSKSSITRATQAIKEGRPCGLNGHPRWLSDKLEDALRAKVQALVAKKVKVTPSIISREVRRATLFFP